MIPEGNENANRKQRRVGDQGLRVAHELRQDRTPQGLQKAPLPLHAAVQRGGESHRAGEQVGEEALCIAQEGALALHAAQLLQEGESYDLRVRKPLYGLVASCLRVDLWA